ncbi:hypothetical protein SpCBS45565_g05452 [Spizellomyces sp. 'palustris']|nr:hypothetical protein SpCBS45565_g05452 [Spizellomyces sp. 'palustris']
MDVKSLTYRACQLLILVIVGITPLAYVYVAGLLYFLLNGIHGRDLAYPHYPYGWKGIAFNIYTTWMLVEALWLPYHLYTFNRLRSRRQTAHAARDADERRTLLTKCLNAIGDASSIRKMIEGWFFETPIEQIRRGNVAEWTAWAFFDKEYTELTDLELEEVDEMVKETEQRIQHRLKDGYDKRVKCIRLTIDEMQMLHRPFIYYVAISIMHALGHVFLRVLGFREASVRAKGNTTGTRQRYYYRPGSSSAKKLEDTRPIVFIHGIGIGFLHYMPLVARLPRDVDVFLLDWPHVSMRLAETVPSIEDTVSSLATILTRHNHTKACFVAHSLGTAAVSWMIHHKPDMVASTVFLDPIVFLLVHPAIAYNFVYRAPTTTTELLMHYFVSRELYIAHSLARHFIWSENVLFKEDLPINEKHLVLLSSKDQIVPSQAVRQYLQDSKVDLLWLENTAHGALMFKQDTLSVLQCKIEEACGLRA